MNNNDNVEFVYNIERKIREDEEEFIYTIIKPFCETVVEKRLSKAELKLILLKGMQKSIPLDKVKQAIEDIEQAYGDYDGYDPDALRDYSDRVYGILDKLIAESENWYGM